MPTGADFYMCHENVFFFDMFYMISLYFPFLLLEICVYLKRLQVGCQAHALERTKLFLVLVYKTAGTVSQVNDESSSFWLTINKCVLGFHISYLIRALLSSVLPFFILPWHWFLGRRTGHCWRGRARSLPENMYQQHPLSIFYLFSISRTFQRREVRRMMSSTDAPAPSSCREELCLYHFVSNLQG